MGSAELAIFDFDDTLVHLDVDWPSARTELLSLAARAGIAADAGLHLAVMANDLSKAGLKEEVDSIFRRHEADCVRERSYEVFPNMVSLVGELKTGGIKLAIASGNHTESITSILSQLGLSDAFDIVCGRDLVAKNKPDPDQLEHIIRELGASKERTVFAGDSMNDEAAARAAGIMYVKILPDREADGARTLRELLL